MSPSQITSCANASSSPSTSPKLKASKFSPITHTDFRIFEESLGAVASQSSSNFDRNNHAGLAKRVKVTGSGLSSGSTGVINKFRMTLPNVGFGFVDLRFSGPSRIILNSQHTKTGFLEIFYKVNEPGNYNLAIRYLGNEIPGSDFKIKVKQQECNPKAIVVAGKGLKKVKAGERATFSVDTRKAGSGKLDVSIQSLGAEQREIKAYVDATKTGYMVEYHPLCVGYHSITVKYNDVHVLGSPFKAKIAAVSTSPLIVKDNLQDFEYQKLLYNLNVQNECENTEDEKKYRPKSFGMKFLRLPDLRKTIMSH